MTCKECFHYEPCFSGGASMWDNIEQTEQDHCKHLKDKKAVLSALEKQIPKKPAPTQQPCKTRFACSICDKRIYSKQKFCDRCGQTLDWSDTE